MPPSTARGGAPAASTTSGTATSHNPRASSRLGGDAATLAAAPTAMHADPNSRRRGREDDPSPPIPSDASSHTARLARGGSRPAVVFRGRRTRGCRRCSGERCDRSRAGEGGDWRQRGHGRGRGRRHALRLVGLRRQREHLLPLRHGSLLAEIRAHVALERVEVLEDDRHLVRPCERAPS